MLMYIKSVAQLYVSNTVAFNYSNTPFLLLGSYGKITNTRFNGFVSDFKEVSQYEEPHNELF